MGLAGRFSQCGKARCSQRCPRILRGGRRPSEIPPIEFSEPKYDWRQLQRWNISESRLPPGSKVLFREPTAWERYSWQISATAAALLFQALMITGLIYEHRRRRNAEIEARQRMFELAHMNRHATAGELSASIAHELNQPSAPYSTTSRQTSSSTQRRRTSTMKTIPMRSGATTSGQPSHTAAAWSAQEDATETQIIDPRNSPRGVSTSFCALR
jgi:hypothetical protein